MTSGQKREPELDRLGRESFITLFLAAGRMTDEVEAVCKEEGLTMSHYTVLWVVCLAASEHPEGVPMRVVADGLLTRAADATRLVDRLTRDGYVERTQSPEDRRVVLVRPTRSGRTLFQRLTAQVKALHREQWSSLTLAELRMLRGLLVKGLWGEAAPRAGHPLESLPPI
jgi:DNA-binding MarR family transcriptional regulator